MLALWRERPLPPMSSKKPVNILVLTSLTDELLRRIAAVGPDVRVSDGAALLLQEVPSALRVGQQPAPDRSQGRSLNELLAEAEVILGARKAPQDLRARAPKLRWIQWPMAGIDFLKETDVWSDPSVVVTSAAGINARPVAEYVLMAMLALAKGVPRMLASKAGKRWDRFTLGQMRGKTVGIVGFGSIGGEVAHLAQAFGMKLLATKRHVDPEGETPEWVVPPTQLDRLLRESDFVVLTVPATPETVGMIGRRELGLMRPTAVLVNVSRGDVVDEGALVEALREGRLAGAALDVFQEEPLPPGNPLWTMPNVLISAHMAGLFEDYDARVVDLFIANLRHYLAGHRLLNQVDRREGY